jgi:hypothetical protein
VNRLLTRLWFPAVLALLGTPTGAFACSVCLGESDDLQAKSLKWGVLSLLAVVVVVLGGLAAFFVHVARRSAMVAAEDSLAATGNPEFAGPAGKA